MSNEQLDLLWGADEIGKAIRRNRRQTYRLLESGALPAKKVGGVWVASRKILIESLCDARAAFVEEKMRWVVPPGDAPFGEMP